MKIFRFFKKQSKPVSTTATSPGQPRKQPTEYVINGRRHLANVPYILPKDGQETSRLDLQHYLLHALLGSHYAVPLQPDIHRILDVGCGTGRWGLDMAAEFPQTEITGIDLETAISNGDTTPVSTPSNYTFIKGNVLKGLPFENEHFDFVHQRFLVAGIPTQQWPRVIQELIRVTRPGGWVELVEAGETFLHPGPATQRFLQWWQEISSLRGIDASVVGQLDTPLRKAGLQDVQKQIMSVPVGKWGGEAGELLAKDMFTGFSGLKGFFGTHLKVPPAEFDQVMQAMPDEWEENRMEYEFYFIYGQRPA